MIEENIVRYLNMEKLGITWHVCLLLTLSLLIYLFGFGIISKPFEEDFPPPSENYHQMKLIDGSVNSFHLGL